MLRHLNPGVLRPPQSSPDHDGRFLFCKITGFSGYIYKFRNLIIITFIGTQQDATLGKGALDGKHVALKKPKNSGALYHNYKGFFSIVMLALVDGQYKFRWVDAGTAGSCSDAQIFNACQLKGRIEDGRIGFSDPAPITQGGRDVPYFILADDAFALKTWLMKPYGRRAGILSRY